MIAIKGVYFRGIAKGENIVLFWIVVLGVLSLKMFYRLRVFGIEMVEGIVR